MTVHSILYSLPRYYLKGLTLTQPALAEAWACSYDKRYPYDVMWANSSPNRPGQRLGRAYYRCIGRYELLELSQTRQLWLGQACNSKKPSILSLGITPIHFTKFQTKSEQKLKKQLSHGAHKIRQMAEWLAVILQVDQIPCEKLLNPWTIVMFYKQHCKWGTRCSFFKIPWSLLSVA